MDALRARLRAKAEAVVAVVETVVDDLQASHDEPLTLEDGCKTVRLMRQADAMVCQLYATPESVIRTVATSKPAPVAATVTPAAPLAQPKPPPDPNSWAAELARINARYDDNPYEGDDDDDNVPQSVSLEMPAVPAESSDNAVAESPAPVDAPKPLEPTTTASFGDKHINSERPLIGPWRQQTKPPD